MANELKHANLMGLITSAVWNSLQISKSGKKIRQATPRQGWILHWLKHCENTQDENSNSNNLWDSYLDFHIFSTVYRLHFYHVIFSGASFT